MKNEIKYSVVTRAIRMAIRFMNLLKIEVHICKDRPKVLWFKFEGGCEGSMNRATNLLRVKPKKGFFSILVHEIVHYLQLPREEAHIPYWDREQEVEAFAVEALLRVLNRNSLDGSEGVVKEACLFAEKIGTTLPERVEWVDYLLGGTWKPHHLRRKLRMEVAAFRRKVIPS